MRTKVLQETLHVTFVSPVYLYSTIVAITV
jgi:hypothetical protein